jgi:hypothetical protein
MCANDEIKVDARKFSSNGLGNSIGYQNTSEPGKRCIIRSFLVPITPITQRPVSMYWMDVNIPFNNVDNSSINNNQLDDIINSYYIDKSKYNNISNSNDFSIIPNNTLKLTITVKINMPDIGHNCSSRSPRAFSFLYTLHQ